MVGYLACITICGAWTEGLDNCEGDTQPAYAVVRLAVLTGGCNNRTWLEAIERVVS